MSSQWQRRNFSATILVCVLTCGIYLIFLASSNWQQSLAAVGAVNLEMWSLILALSIANYLLRFSRWSLAINALTSIRIPVAEHFLCYIAGFAFTATPGKAGEAIRSLFLERRGLPKGVTFSAFVFERVLDLAAISVLATLLLLEFQQFIPVVLIAALFLLITVLLAQRKIFSWLNGLIRNEKIRSTKSLIAKLFRARSASNGLLIGLASWTLEGIGLFLAIQAMGVHISPILAIGAYGASVLAGALSFIPGGIGGTEAVMVAALVACGVPFPTAVAATLVCRIATLWFAVAVGLLVLPVVLMRHRGKKCP